MKKYKATVTIEYDVCVHDAIYDKENTMLYIKLNIKRLVKAGNCSEGFMNIDLRKRKLKIKKAWW